MQSSPQAATPTFSTTGLVLIGTVITISDSTPGFITITYCFDTNIPDTVYCWYVLHGHDGGVSEGIRYGQRFYAEHYS